MVVEMGLVVAVAFALCSWIVLWALGFGRVGDAFIVTFPLIMIIAVMVRSVRRNLSTTRRQ